MTKNEFLSQLRKGLSGLSRADAEEQLSFYSEMIDDRIEEGMSEAEAVAAVGVPEEIAAQIMANIPLKKNEKRRLKAGEIVLLALGSPIWLSLGIAAVAVIISLYISLWAVIVSLWSVFGAVVACTFGGLLAGAVLACSGNVLPGLAMVAAGIVFAGLSIFLFCGGKAATDGVLLLTKKLIAGRKKGDAQ